MRHLIAGNLEINLKANWPYFWDEQIRQGIRENQLNILTQGCAEKVSGYNEKLISHSPLL